MLVDQNHASALLKRLLLQKNECPWLEFKENYYAPENLGEYLSALANSACVHGMDKGYLVFGIRDITKEISGTSFRPSDCKYKNQPLEFWLNQQLYPKTGFEIKEFMHEGKPVVVFEINSAKGEPVKFNGISYIRIDSCKTELRKHTSIERRIWMFGAPDWTAETPESANLSHLSSEALKKAREEYRKKHQNSIVENEISAWDDATFLNKAKLSIEGRPTNASLILLGKPEAVNFLSPSVAQISWILRDKDGIEMDYGHFSPPFIIQVDHLLQKIRNLNLRIMPDGTLFPVEISQYDPWVLREALHNCIAHQDYRLSSRIVVVESPDSILFANAGAFVPGSVENVLRQDAPQKSYPNRFLTEAMVNLNMIDTIGSGIKRMFFSQKKRFMPMPDYDLSSSKEVKVNISGRVLDVNYTKLLIRNTDLPLGQVLILDKIQKKVPITREAHTALKKCGLAEGRYPNIYVSAHIAAATGNKEQFIKNRGLDKEHYKKLVLSYLKQFEKASRKNIEKLLLGKLPDILDEKQRLNKIKNILSEMSLKDKTIQSVGATSRSEWRLK
jgi:ATP-dependent DNA helicase RecG